MIVSAFPFTAGQCLSSEPTFVVCHVNGSVHKIMQGIPLAYYRLCSLMTEDFWSVDHCAGIFHPVVLVCECLIVQTYHITLFCFFKCIKVCAKVEFYPSIWL